MPAQPSGHQRSIPVALLAVALTLFACAIGVGIGYVIHGAHTTPGTPPVSTQAPDGTSIGPSRMSAIIATVAPSLVNIYATLAYASAQQAGTGMVVTSAGRVITNNHVIAGATAIHATDQGDGKTYDASVVGYDVSEDVAVLQLEGAAHLPTVSFAGSSAQLGDTVIAVGNAGGTGMPTSAAGVVTGLNQTITARSELSGTTELLTGLIETDAAIEAGQSGGPLVDTRGRVIGMVTAGSSDFALSEGASQGYAIPASTFRSTTADIVNGRESATLHVGPTAFLGVRVTSVQQPGAFVVQVLSASPAASAGILPGDLIVGLAHEAVRAPETLSSVLASYDPGAKLSVRLRDQAGEQRTVVVTLGVGPPA
jgi:S1-C subfamily serine protease